MQIKICGITSQNEIEVLNELKCDYAGFVLFYEKSKRNIELQHAVNLKNLLSYSKSVAVTVSPDFEQASSIEGAGFDILQVHGELRDEVRNGCNMKIWRAVNISGQKYDDFAKALDDDRISGIVLDGASAGSGEQFDWKMFNNIYDKYFKSNNKLLILAGGLNPQNVSDAVKIIQPDAVDVSSGVEYDDKMKDGKDLNKIRSFINNVRNIK